VFTAYREISAGIQRMSIKTGTMSVHEENSSVLDYVVRLRIAKMCYNSTSERQPHAQPRSAVAARLKQGLGLTSSNLIGGS